MKKIFYAVISTISGLIILLGIFFPDSVLGLIKLKFLDWTIILSAVSLIVAILSLISVHWNKLFSENNRNYASLFLILGFIIVLLLGIFAGPTSQIFNNINRTVIITVESSLLAVLSLTLALASYRYFTKKQDLLAIIFGISTIIFLLLFSGIISAGESLPFVKSIISALHSLPVAGSIGILIGISLGAIITSLRILFGLNRPFDR